MSGMRILIVSDTHRRDGNFRRVLEKTGPIDMLIHLGDTEGSEIYFKEWVNNDNCVIRVVRGNNDFFSQTDREKEISIGKYRAFLTHGHMYGVSFELETIKEEARARKVDIVMFGHTHKPHLEYCEDGLVVLNPGSLSYPRQDGTTPSYMLMEIDQNGEAHYTVCYVDQDRDIIAVNPGSLTYPRQEGRSPSYIVMTITDGIKQDVSFEIRYL